MGKNMDLPVYFGDTGSPAVLHAVGAERAACAVITLDTPGVCVGGGGLALMDFTQGEDVAPQTPIAHLLTILTSDAPLSSQAA